MAIGNKYKYWKVLGFVATERADNTNTGYTYLYCFIGTYYILSIFLVVCPHITRKYFNYSNVIEQHNKIRQYDLVIDKYWAKQNGYFILVTTVSSGTVVTDTKFSLCHGISEKIRDNKSMIK